MRHDRDPQQPAPFHPVGLRMVRVVVMVAIFCSVAAMLLQMAYSIRSAHATFDAGIHEITAIRLPLLSAALWDIEPGIVQKQIDEIAVTRQIAGVRLVTTAGMNLQAGRLPPAAGVSSMADEVLDIPAPAGQGSALGKLYINFDHDYMVRQVMTDMAVTAAFIGIFTVLLCFLLIRFLRAEITTPLQRLLDHVNTLSPDALGVPYSSGRASRSSRDELDQLAEGFTTLHGGIARYVEERNQAETALAQERDQLEEKVAERTHDLEAARDRADTASRSKSEFLANMSHEIRTPINAISGFTALALRTELTPKQTDYLDKIHHATQGLLRIISDLLDFSKIEAGHLDMERIPFRLGEIMETTVSYVGSLAERKGLELLVHVAPDVPPRWMGDPLRLGQVLINLCSNAVKFTERGEVEIRVILVSKTAGSARLLFSVRDTGIGLTPEQSGKLFHAFSQADSSTTRKFGGTGLGLVISERLVGMMNGRIWFESQEGIGTTFFFEVELDLADASALPDCPQLPPELMGQYALVVDDNANARQILAAQLSGLGMVPHAVDSGEAALAEMRQMSAQGSQYPVVLMDWKMPGLDGVSTARAIRADPAIAGTPVVIMVTAYGREQVMNAIKDDGLLDDILLKPVTPSLLAEILCRERGTPASRSGSQRPLTARAKRLKGARLLLIEDNPINQQLAQELLEQDGAEVKIAGNGRIALDMLETFGLDYFDAALVDLQMPEMDGYETALKVREMPLHGRLPLIAMTAHAMVEERERCLAVGMKDHIAKPIDPELLVNKLMLWIGPEKLAGAAIRAEVQVPAGVPDKPAEVPDRLPGVDIAAGLRRCGGSTRLYHDLLFQFHQHYADAVAQMNQLYAAGDFPGAYHLAHTIKGAAANLAMDDLAKVAAALESALKEKPGVTSGGREYE